jgi:hypothetical protein
VELKNTLPSPNQQPSRRANVAPPCSSPCSKTADELVSASGGSGSSMSTQRTGSGLPTRWPVRVS